MTVGDIGQVVGVGRSVVRQGIEFRVAPDRLDRLELRRVSREVLGTQPGMATEEALHGTRRGRTRRGRTRQPADAQLYCSVPRGPRRLLRIRSRHL